MLPSPREFMPTPHRAPEGVVPWEGGLPEEDLLEPLEEVMRMQDEDVGVELHPATLSPTFPYPPPFPPTQIIQPDVGLPAEAPPEPMEEVQRTEHTEWWYSGKEHHIDGEGLEHGKNPTEMHPEDVP